MDNHCTCCCGLFWFRKSSSSGKEAKSSSKPGIVKRISKEHLLSYSVEENNHETATRKQQLARKQSTAELPLNTHYCPPYKLESGVSLGPLVLPLLRAGVKETRHEFKSQVPAHPSQLLQGLYEVNYTCSLIFTFILLIPFKRQRGFSQQHLVFPWPLLWIHTIKSGHILILPSSA